MSNSNLIYHYTSFEKLKCILEHGTLRFKESTKSNDILDTACVVNILKTMPHFKANVEMTELLNFILGYYQREAYDSSSISLVSCFSEIADSRLLWDAYTMHRPGNQKCSYGEQKFCYETVSKYNGVCIAFRKDQLQKLLEKEIGRSCDNSIVKNIDYGDAKLKFLLNEWLKEAALDSLNLSKEPDQSQNIIPPILATRKTELHIKKCLVFPTLDFIQKVEEYSPFFKHQFWHEEKEVRASLFIKKGNIKKYKTISQYDDSSYYCDISITPDCIDHFILGPEFNEKNLSEIKQHKEYKLNICDFELKYSVGTGVIRNN